ncbi:Bug family tripartite tricarboxylate transporter substrate binding protein [Bordetella sp. 2513F-2]
MNHQDEQRAVPDVRRRQLMGWLGAAVLATHAGVSRAATWPARPIRLIVGWPPGGGTDAVARIVAQQLEPMLGQSIVVENRGGANGRIGINAVRQAAADGYTFLFQADLELPAANLDQALTEKYASFDPLAGLVPVGGIGRGPYLLVAGMSTPVKDLASLIAYAKQNPRKLNYGSFGAGSINQSMTELLNLREGIETVEIPYQGAGPLLMALVGGQVDFAFVTPSSALPLVRDGRLRGIAVLSDQRLPDVEVPTMAELGLQDFNGGSLYGVLAPPATPAPIIDRLAQALHQLSAKLELAAAFNKISIFPVDLQPERMQSVLAQNLHTRRQLGAKLGIELQ